jgi:hypothetical protein
MKNINKDTRFAPPHTDTYCGVEAKAPNGCKLDPVAFMGNPNSPEVQQLLSIYEDELRQAWVIYKQTKDQLKDV